MSFFRARCAMHSSKVDELLQFFAANSKRQAWLQGAPALLEQIYQCNFFTKAQLGTNV